jgi:hypothetical protein
MLLDNCFDGSASKPEHHEQETIKHVAITYQPLAGIAAY